MFYYLSILILLAHYGFFTCLADNINNVTAPTTYTIGDPITITWDNNLIANNTVSIYLQYQLSVNVQQIFYLAQDVNNTGNITLTFNYTNELSHLSIPHNTTGQFVVYNNLILLTSTTANIYQPIYMTSALGAIHPNNMNLMLTFQVYVKNSIVAALGGNESVDFYGSFITLNGNSWTTIESLVTHYLPTLSPTPSPTPLPTKSPTTPFPTSAPVVSPTSSPTSSPTPSPTTFPTTLPTPAPTLVPTPFPTSSPTTPKPTSSPIPAPTSSPIPAPTSAPTSSPISSPTSFPTTLAPTTLAPTTLAPTTLAPTTLAPTPVSTLAPATTTPNISRRLFNDNDDGYTEFSVKVNVVAINSTVGGPYLLNIGIQNTTMTNYYTINGADNNVIEDPMYQFVIYDPNNVKLSLLYDEEEVDAIAYYQNINYKFEISEELKNLPLYFVIYPTGSTSSNGYATSCQSRLASEWENDGKFGWKFQDSYDNGTILPSVYTWMIVWAATDNFTTLLENTGQYALIDINNSIPFDTFIHYDYNLSNSTYVYPAVSITNEKDNSNSLKVDKNTKYTWVFTTSYAFNEIIYFYFVQTGSSNNIFSNNTYNFTYKEDGTTYTFTTPDSLVIDSSNSTHTYVYVYTYLCDQKTKMFTIINVETEKEEGKKNKDNGLSAGAIVGITVAGVVVVGVAAWWFCMRKSASDARYHQLE